MSASGLAIRFDEGGTTQNMHGRLLPEVCLATTRSTPLDVMMPVIA
jgi:hypothetical protein